MQNRKNTKRNANATDARVAAILVRVSAAEKAKLKRASRVEGLGVSTMLRSLGLERARRLSAS